MVGDCLLLRAQPAKVLIAVSVLIQSDMTVCFWRQLVTMTNG
jgi:hypothetical protein